MKSSAREQEVTKVPAGGSKSLVFAQPFFLRRLEDDKFLSATAEGDCQFSHSIYRDSVFTFHDESGDQKNYSGDKFFFPVTDQAEITIFANIGMGKYLEPSKTSRKARHYDLAWKGSPEQVENATSKHYTFIVHANRPTRSPSRNFLGRSRMFKRSSMESGTVSRSDRLGRRSWNSGKPIAVDDPDDSSVCQVDESDRSKVKKTYKHKSSTARFLSGVFSPRAAKRSASYLKSLPNRPSLADRNSSQKKPMENISFGDVITLESKQRPGYYLNTKRLGKQLKLVRGRATEFVISAPELHQLLKMNNNTEKMINAHPRSTGGRFQRKAVAKKPLTPKELEFHSLMQQLPVDLALEIICYLPKWHLVARTVCRQWRNIGDRQIKKIRVNGHFDDIITLSERRNLFTWLRRCSNLRHVNIRNCEAIVDDDFRQLNPTRTENPQLRELSIGGCRSLGNGCIPHLARLPKLNHLSLAVTQIDDEGLALLTNAAPNLTYLNLYGCKNITMEGVEYFLSNMKAMKDINLRGTPITLLSQGVFRRGVTILTGPEDLDNIYS